MRRRRKKKNYVPFKLIGVLIVIIVSIIFIVSVGFAPQKPFDTEAYLNKYGWQIDKSSEVHRVVTIPADFSISDEAYNCLQKDIGTDLSDYKGKNADMYIYKVINRYIKFKNQKIPMKVQVTVYDNKPIAASVFSDSLKGAELSLKGRSVEAIVGMSIEKWKNTLKN